MLHNFSFQPSNLIYWYKKILPLKKPSGEIYKKRKRLEKTFGNKGFFKPVYIYFQPKDEEGPEGLAFQVVISLK